jgi:SAM-dependent methyltransferase
VNRIDIQGRLHAAVGTQGGRVGRTGSKWFVNSSRVHLGNHVRRFARHTRGGMLALDAGAGGGPYKDLFGHAIYEAADFAQLSGRRYAPLDYVCDLNDIPVEEGRFDRVLFNQVLEHVPDPPLVLAELHRVLKPGGRIFCSAPLFYPEHQKPYDYFRYTRYALQKLFEDAGFEVERIRWVEGYFGTVGYQFQQMYSQLPRDTSHLQGGWRGVPLRLLVWLTRQYAWFAGGAFARADVRWKHTKSGHPKNYMVIARKPAAGAPDS